MGHPFSSTGDRRSTAGGRRAFGYLKDFEIDQIFAFLHAGRVYPRHHETMGTELQKWKSAEAKERFHTALFRRNLQLTVSDECLLSIWRKDVNKYATVEVSGADRLFPDESKDEHLNVDRNLGGPNFIDDVENGKTSGLLIDRGGQTQRRKRTLEIRWGHIPRLCHDYVTNVR